MISKEIGKPVSTTVPEGQQFEECDADYFFEESLKVLEEGKMEGERARTLREWARYEWRDGHTERGVKMWKQAREIFDELGAELEVERMAGLPG